MNARQREILLALVEEYIHLGEPIGSLTLLESYNFPFSPATIRGEMNRLEEEDYLSHPYTSSGRVPTERGYRVYVNGLEKNYSLGAREKEAIKRRFLAVQDHYQRLFLTAAQTLSEVTDLMSVASFGSEVYYTGMAKLFRHPEFLNPDQVLEIANVFDNLEEFIKHLPEEKGTSVLIGEENPLGKQAGFSFAYSSFLGFDNTRNYLGILGPTRMDYNKNLSLLDELTLILKEF